MGGVPGRIPDGVVGDPLPHMGVYGGSYWNNLGSARAGSESHLREDMLGIYGINGVPPGRPYGVRYWYGILCGALGAAPYL